MLSVIREGVEYSVSDGTICRFVGQDGWGLSPLHRLDERGPLQHGDTDIDFRLDPRIGRIALQVNGSTHEDMYEKRQRLIALFGPLGGPLSLRWSVMGDRQIDVHFAGDMGFGSSDRRGWVQNTVVTLKASDPTFYDPIQVLATFALGGGVDTLEIPHPVPHTVGASSIGGLQTIQYAGNWDSYPLILFYGPMTNPVLTNETTGEKLDFTGTTIAAGDYYTVDLAYGAKTVIEDDGTNRIATLTDDSDLATFHLERGPGPAGLDSVNPNSLSFTASAITGASKVDIFYFTRYLGI